MSTSVVFAGPARKSEPRQTRRPARIRRGMRIHKNALTLCFPPDAARPGLIEENERAGGFFWKTGPKH
jgi:hypothetical protein